MVTSTELNALELYDLNRTEIKKKSLKLKDRMQTNNYYELCNARRKGY
jgi:uncharacterized protein YdcH (DUF465 family)